MDDNRFSKDAILVLIASFFYMICPMLSAPIIAGYTENLGGRGMLMGLVGGMMNMTALFCRPFIGNLADRIPKYRLVMIGTLFLLAGSMGYFMAPSPELLMLARIVDGIGFASCSIGLSSWLVSVVPDTKVGSAMGMYGAVQAIGMAAAPPIGIFVADKCGYRFSFLVTASCAIITMIFINFVKNRGIPVKSESTEKKRLEIFEKKVVPIALIVMFFTIPYYATQSFLLSYVQRAGLSVDAKWFFTVYAIFLVLLRTTLSRFFNIVPYRRFLFISIISSVVMIGCMTFMKGNFLLFTAAFFMAGGYGIMCSVSQSAAMTLAGIWRRGVGTSTYYIGLDIGMMTGPILAGFIYSNVNISYFYPCMLFCPAGCILVYLISRKTLRNA
ncbi:MFS transporter [Anaerotignum sp.]